MALPSFLSPTSPSPPPISTPPPPPSPSNHCRPFLLLLLLLHPPNTNANPNTNLLPLPHLPLPPGLLHLLLLPPYPLISSPPLPPLPPPSNAHRTFLLLRLLQPQNPNPNFLSLARTSLSLLVFSTSLSFLPTPLSCHPLSLPCHQIFIVQSSSSFSSSSSNPSNPNHHSNFLSLAHTSISLVFSASLSFRPTKPPVATVNGLASRSTDRRGEAG